MHLTAQQQKLFDIRAALQAGVSRIVWELVDMERSGENETQVCQELCLEAVMGSRQAGEQLLCLRSQGQNINPVYTALERIRDRRKACLAKIIESLKQQQLVD